MYQIDESWSCFRAARERFAEVMPRTARGTSRAWRALPDVACSAILAHADAIEDGRHRSVQIRRACEVVRAFPEEPTIADSVLSEAFARVHAARADVLRRRSASTADRHAATRELDEATIAAASAVLVRHGSDVEAVRAWRIVLRQQQHEEHGSRVARHRDVGPVSDEASRIVASQDRTLVSGHSKQLVERPLVARQNQALVSSPIKKLLDRLLEGTAHADAVATLKVATKAADELGYHAGFQAADVPLARDRACPIGVIAGVGADPFQRASVRVYEDTGMVEVAVVRNGDPHAPAIKSLHPIDLVLSDEHDHADGGAFEEVRKLVVAWRAGRHPRPALARPEGWSYDAACLPVFLETFDLGGHLSDVYAGPGGRVWVVSERGDRPHVTSHTVDDLAGELHLLAARDASVLMGAWERFAASRRFSLVHRLSGEFDFRGAVFTLAEARERDLGASCFRIRARW